MKNKYRCDVCKDSGAVKTEEFEANGFIQGFPFVDHYRKDITPLAIIHIHSCYHLQRKDIVEDENVGSLYYKVTKIKLPKSETKIFHKIENALKYANEK